MKWGGQEPDWSGFKREQESKLRQHDRIPSRNFTLKGSKIKEPQLEKDVRSREDFFKHETLTAVCVVRGMMYKRGE